MELSRRRLVRKGGGRKQTAVGCSCSAIGDLHVLGETRVSVEIRIVEPPRSPCARDRVARRRWDSVHVWKHWTSTGRSVLHAVATGFVLVAGAGQADPVANRAAAVERSMTPAERTVLTHGLLNVPVLGGVPKEKPFGAGFVSGIPRLGIPALKETDASLGVAWYWGVRGDEGATALPAGLATASSWNPDLARRGGTVIGADARAKGFNVLLAGGANLMRDSRNGRTFEYLSEDPLLTGVLAGEAVAGIQSNHIISTVKHFALNDQETARSFVNAKISESSARESDLLAFEIAIERGHPGSVMCAYNKVNGAYACDNDWLLNQVLKRDWHYPGFVMSDWGAVPGPSAALNGLDQESGLLQSAHSNLDQPLAAAAARDPRSAARLADMNRRILHAIFANGLDRFPVSSATLDERGGLAVAEEIERQGIVLLRNQANVLPLSASVKRIAVIGGYANTGVLGGGGSSEVELDGGPAAAVPVGGDGPFAALLAERYQRSVPLKAIRARAPSASVTYTRGNYVAEAVRAARDADIAIVFATAWRTEGEDVPDLSLPNGQDDLIEAVAAANPRTIVILETGGPVLMPWLGRTAAVLEAWYPGGRGAEAIASVLFGDANPSGRLPVSFPRSIADLPRPAIDGWGQELPLKPFASPAPPITADYDIEGSDVGYRWYSRQGKPTLFPFGYGLSYTSFVRGGLKTDGRTASFSIVNSGGRAGADVGQLYLVSVAGEPKLRLVAFDKVFLKPGEQRKITVSIDQRLLASWKDRGWTIRGGTYEFAIGADAEHLGPSVAVKLHARTWRD